MKNESGEQILINGKHEARYFLPVGVVPHVSEGDTVPRRRCHRQAAP